MTSQEFKTIQRILAQVYQELETEALNSGISLLSSEYQTMKQQARLAVLNKYEITSEEYSKAKADNSSFSQEDIGINTEEIRALKEKVDSLEFPTLEDVESISYKVAQQFIKPPQITNQIVKEITIEKPQIIRETTIEKTVETVNYNEKPLQEKINAISKRVDELPQPFDKEKFKEEISSVFMKMFEKNINTLGMPNFRKLAMGLQGQIDVLSAGGGGTSSSGYQAPLSGGLTGTNTWATAPNVIVVDGVPMQKTRTDGTVNWTGTTTTVLTIVPSFDVFSSA